MPALLAFVGLLIAGGRYTHSRNTVDHAVESAARAASLQRSAAAASTRGGQVADQYLTAEGLRCDDRRLDVDVAGFQTPVGQPATVTVTLTCTVPLADIALPGLPGAKQVTAQATSPLDVYRARSTP